MGYQYKVDIAGTEYGMTDLKVVNLEAPLFDHLSVGNTCSAELDITFWQKSEIPKMAQIIPRVQLGDGSWYQLGVFYTDTRIKRGEALNIVAYDAMMKGEVVWEPDINLIFPMTMTYAVQVIADLMGVEIDPRTELNEAYTIDYPIGEQTLRETLGWIGAAHAGNWIITNEGKLLLVPLFDSVPVSDGVLVTEDGAAIALGGVRLLV